MNAALIVYFSTGIAVHVALYFLFKRMGLSAGAGRLQWWHAMPEGLILGLLFWPITTPLILLGGFLEYWHLISKRKAEQKRAEERAMKVDREGKFADMNMDALLEAQRQVLQKTGQLPPTP